MSTHYYNQNSDQGTLFASNPLGVYIACAHNPSKNYLFTRHPASESLRDRHLIPRSRKILTAPAGRKSTLQSSTPSDAPPLRGRAWYKRGPARFPHPFPAFTPEPIISRTSRPPSSLRRSGPLFDRPLLLLSVSIHRCRRRIRGRP